MKKWLKVLFSLNSLRKELGYSVFVRANKFNFHPEILKNLETKSVLVLSPHADDDCFGCGGTLKKLSASGCEITVVYFCDGVGGVAAGSNDKIDRNLKSIRRAEAKAAGKILGFKEQIFWDFPDDKLTSSATSVKLLQDLIKRVKPDIIFTPSFLDNHPDHRATNEILVESLVDINIDTQIWAYDLQIWAYEIWTPVYANRIMMINTEIEAKKNSIQVHKSQLKGRNYEKAILGLNQYRAEINNESGYGEGFFASSAEIYKKLFKKSQN